MTLPPEAIERVLAYIRKQVAERSVEDTLARLRSAAGDLHSAARAVADFELPRSPDEWSANQCLTHVVEWNLRNAREILYVALSGELPNREAADVPAQREALITAHDESIESLSAHVIEAAPEGFLHIRWQHPFFGPLNWREWLAFLEVHCRDHAGQLRAMQRA
jgi:DinB superfamily